MAMLELPVRERGVCCAPSLPLPSKRAGELAVVLKALADPTRLQMTVILRDATEPVCICDLTGAFDLSQPTVWHHMAKLREAGLVDCEKRGIWAFYWLRKDLSPEKRALIEALA
jgi:DNA-binding transcriptional ArsR family regulator